MINKDLKDILRKGKLDMSDINLKISHLSENLIRELIIDYYSDHSVSKLLVKYNISARTSELIKLLPKIILEELHCKYCLLPMTLSLPSKTSSLNFAPQCVICGHYVGTYCSCAGCLNEKKKIYEDEITLKKEMIKSVFMIDHYGPFKIPGELSLKEAVYLLIFYRYCTNEDVLNGNLRNIVDVPLTPGEEYNLSIIEYLLKSTLITLSPSSDVRAFSFSSELNAISGYYPISVDYRFLLGETTEEIYNYIGALESLIYSRNWPVLWKEQLEKLQFELAIFECFEYLLYQAEAHKLVATRGDKTKLMFINLLKDFSVSQIFRIIYISVRSAVAFRAKQNVSKKHAANTIVGSCQRYADRARAEKWDLKPFVRDSNCSRSALSYVMYNVFLQSDVDSIHTKIPVKEDFYNVEPIVT